MKGSKWEKDETEETLESCIEFKHAATFINIDGEGENDKSFSFCRTLIISTVYLLQEVYLLCILSEFYVCFQFYAE